MIQTPSMDQAQLELEAGDVKKQLVSILNKKKPIELELSSLKSRVVSSNTHKTRLSPEDYRGICNRQQSLKRKLSDIELEASSVKTKLRDLSPR